jgi:hypothetical protein
MANPSPVPYVSPGYIVARVAQLEPELRANVIGEGVYRRDHRLLSAAIAVFRAFFGEDWLIARLRNPFIRPPIGAPIDEYKPVDRIVTLAELLVNLQEVPGFEWCLGEVRTDSVESGLAKLAAAGMLRRRAIPFHFVVPRGHLGQDYDAEALIGATRVAIEMKAKVEGREPSSSSVLETLRRARDQFPQDTPNVVFLRVPGAWGESSEGRQAIVEGVEQQFRNSATVGMVVSHWERWAPIEPDGSVEKYTDRLLISINPRARVRLTALHTALLEGPPPGIFPWLSFGDLFPE